MNCSHVKVLPVETLDGEIVAALCAECLAAGPMWWLQTGHDGLKPAPRDTGWIRQESIR
jgi:hypothetical protein